MTEPLIVITADNGRPHTMNTMRREHAQVSGKKIHATRELWGWLGIEHKVRSHRLDQVTIDVTPLHRDGRSPQDIVGCAPEAKAAIDGLVDAGLIPDDNPKHLRLVTFHPPRICGIDGLELAVYNAQEGAEP